MPRISNFEILNRPEQPILSLRKVTTVQNLPQVIGGGFGQIAALMAELGESPADLPFVCYHSTDPQSLDVEIGFPLPKPLEGKGEIRPAAVPAGKVVFCMYLGDYGDIEPVYSEMSKWAADNGLAPTGESYEHYYNGEEYPVEQMLTRIVMPVK